MIFYYSFEYNIIEREVRTLSMELKCIQLSACKYKSFLSCISTTVDFDSRYENRYFRIIFIWNFDEIKKNIPNVGVTKLEFTYF